MTDAERKYLEERGWVQCPKLMDGWLVHPLIPEHDINHYEDYEALVIQRFADAAVNAALEKAAKAIEERVYHAYNLQEACVSAIRAMKEENEQSSA